MGFQGIYTHWSFTYLLISVVLITVCTSKNSTGISIIQKYICNIIWRKKKRLYPGRFDYSSIEQFCLPIEVIRFETFNYMNNEHFRTALSKKSTRYLLYCQVEVNNNYIYKQLKMVLQVLMYWILKYLFLLNLQYIWNISLLNIGLLFCFCDTSSPVLYVIVLSWTQPEFNFQAYKLIYFWQVKVNNCVPELHDFFSFSCS